MQRTAFRFAPVHLLLVIATFTGLRFDQFDTNKDGFLSREEFVTSGGKNK